ncbi:MAG: helix-hairpin-helix domain-containing protein [Actinomycetota bacterium]
MDGGVRDWLAGLTRRELALVAVVGLAVVGAAGLWYARSLPRPVEVRAPAAAPTLSAEPATVLVHVAGWVRRAGVYELDEGDRVVDAIDAAGGPRRGADLGALNLAAVLVDAQQVLVPRAVDQAEGPGIDSSTGAGTAAPQLVNVNTASPEELDTLPGIGEVLAAAIVSYREEHGPFTAVDQLVDVSGIGEVTMEEIRDLVTV